MACLLFPSWKLFPFCRGGGGLVWVVLGGSFWRLSAAAIEVSDPFQTVSLFLYQQALREQAPPPVTIPKSFFHLFDSQLFSRTAQMPSLFRPRFFVLCFYSNLHLFISPPRLLHSHLVLRHSVVDSILAPPLLRGGSWWQRFLSVRSRPRPSSPLHLVSEQIQAVP